MRLVQYSNDRLEAVVSTGEKANVLWSGSHVMSLKSYFSKDIPTLQ